MSLKDQKTGYKRSEFSAIFQIYARYVYRGLFKDFSFADINGKYFISFREEAGKTPLITVEKKRLGPDRALFIATTPAGHSRLREIARSEKITSFTQQLVQFIDTTLAEREVSKTRNPHTQSGA